MLYIINGMLSCWAVRQFCLRRVGLAFMQVYVARKSEYHSYLQSAYVESLDVPPFDFSLLRSFSDEALNPLLHQHELNDL